jgi:hypothetical protein
MSQKRATGLLRRMCLGLNRMSLFSRCVVAGAALSVAGGGVWGFVRGLCYLPTLPFAIVEGAILIGVPGTVVGIVVAGAISLIARLCR